MTTKQIPWFLQERAVAFASLLLTERGNVKIHPTPNSDMAIDLLVEILEEGKSTLRFFGVQLIASLDLPGIQDADEEVLGHFRNRGSESDLPLCVFLVGVRKPEGVYRWVVEPVIDGGGRAVLHREGKKNWQLLDERGVTDLIGQVEAWYAAHQHRFVPKKRDRQANPGDGG